ncbi:MAG: hypothetical protein AAGJ83_05295, partial [Planctomycetota bacterium]
MKISTFLLFCLAIPEFAAAQPPLAYRYPARLRWAAYDPSYAVTSRIYAQADLIRAQGAASVSIAQARQIHAEAYSKELDNWKKELRAYWDRKLITDEKKLELNLVRQISRMKYLNDQKWQNSRLWDRFKNHPELSSTKIRNGKALNFMLARLAANSLPYRFDPSVSRYSDDALRDLDLDPQLLSHVTLKQGSFSFNAGQPMDGTISSWPYILRWSEFDNARDAFEVTRAAVFLESENQGHASVDAIRDMENALLELTNQFHGSDRVAHLIEERTKYTHFYSADRFLQELD